MKITPEIAEEINELYLEIGIKKKVAEIIGCSPSTVSRYIVPNYVSKKQWPAYTFDGTVGDASWLIDVIKEVDNAPRRFCELCMLSKEEIAEMAELQKEVYI